MTPTKRQLDLLNILADEPARKGYLRAQGIKDNTLNSCLLNQWIKPVADSRYGLTDFGWAVRKARERVR